MPLYPVNLRFGISGINATQEGAPLSFSSRVVAGLARRYGIAKYQLPKSCHRHEVVRDDTPVFRSALAPAEDAKTTELLENRNPLCFGHSLARRDDFPKSPRNVVLQSTEVFSARHSSVGQLALKAQVMMGNLCCLPGKIGHLCQSELRLALVVGGTRPIAAGGE